MLPIKLLQQNASMYVSNKQQTSSYAGVVCREGGLGVKPLKHWLTCNFFLPIWANVLLFRAMDY